MSESTYLVAATRPWNREVLMLLAERVVMSMRREQT